MAFDIYEKLGVESSAKKNPPKFNIRERLGVDKPKQDNAFVQGLRQVGSSVDFGAEMTTQDYRGAAQTIADQQAYLRRNPGSTQGQELSEAWEQGDGVLGGVREVAKEIVTDFREAPTVLEGIGETGANLRAMGGGIVKQIPNMLPPVTGMVAGGAAGSTVGPLGTAAGGFAGASAGNTLVEGQGIAMEQMAEAGVNLNDVDAMAEYLENNAGSLFGKAATKGSIIGAVDTATAGLGNMILKAPAKAVLTRQMVDMGVDVTDSAAVKAAMQTDELATRVINDVAFQASKQGKGNLARNLSAAAVDPAGEFAGEFLGSGVALGDWDAKEATLEALSSIGQSGVIFAGQKGVEVATRPPGYNGEPQQTEQPAFPGTLGEEFAVGLRQQKPEPFEDILESREFARIEREAKLYNQRRNLPQEDFSNVELPTPAAPREDRPFGGTFAQPPLTVEEQELQDFQQPEIITNRGGGVFKSESAAIGEVNKRKADGLYTAVPQDDGFVAQRVQPEGAFTKKDGTGFATETALNRIASKERVALDEYKVLKTNKGFIAVPQERTDGTARQEGVDGNQTADIGGVADVAQGRQRDALLEEEIGGVGEQGAVPREQPGQVRPAAGLRAEITGGGTTNADVQNAAESENALPRDIDEAPDENRTVEKIGETDVRYEGSDSLGLHYYTALSGPSAGGTFAVENQEPANVETALKNQEAKFSQTDEALGDIAADAFQTAQRTGTQTQTTVGQFLKTAAAQDESKSVKAIATVLDKVINKQRANGIVIIDPTARVSYYNQDTNTTVIRANAETKEGLHEVVHALTAREIRANKQLRKKIRSLSSQVKAQAIKQGLLTQEQITEIESLGTSREFKTQQDSYGANRGIAYAFLNEREFLAQAMNSPAFQQLLVDTKIKRGGKLRSAWDTFVDMITSALGLPKNVSKTAFAEVLSVTTAVARSAPGSEIQAFDEAIDEAPDFLNETSQAGKEKVTQAAKALANPKGKLKEIYEQYAPQWLSVTPLNTLVQTFGKNIQQIKDFARHIDEMGFVKSDIVTTAFNLHQDANRLAKKTVGLDSFNDVADTASFFRMTPWKGIMEQDWVPNTGTKEERLVAARSAWINSGLKKASGGLTYDAAYKQAKKKYDRLNPETKEAYEKIVDHLGELRTREKTNLLAYIEANSEEGSDLRAKLMEQYERSFPKIGGAYMPLSRVGDYRLEFEDVDGVRVVQHFRTISERSAAADILAQSDINTDTIKESVVDKKGGGATAIPQMLMGQLSDAVEEQHLKNVDPENEDSVAAAKDRAASVIENMNQIWLRWQPETSALKNSIRRSNVRGYDKDMLRSYIDYAQRHAGSIAWTEQGRKVEADITSLADQLADEKKEPGRKDLTMKGHLLNDMRARVNSIRSVHVGRAASFAGKLGTAYYMTSPSIALVQMSQLGVLTLPKLAVKYKSPAKVAKAMGLGLKKSVSKDYTEDAIFAEEPVNIVFENIRRVVTEEDRIAGRGEGKAVGEKMFSKEEIQEQFEGLSDKNKELLVLREAMARNLLDISAAYEAYEIARSGDPEALTSKIFDLAMQPMKLSELTSRKTAVLATYELSKDKNFLDTMDDVGEVINETLFNYSKEHKGAAMQGGTARVILQFQHFRIMTGIRLALLFKNAIRNQDVETRRAAQKEFVGIMGVTGVLAGTTGLPMANVLFYIMDTMLGDDDEPIDSKLMFTNWLREQFGEKGAEIATKGLPAAAGMDISRRIGLGDVYGVQNTPPPGMHGKQLAAWWAATQLGPVFSVASGWLQGFDEMFRKGNFMRGLEDATPKPVRDVLKSYRVATEGVKTRAGERLLNDDEINADDVFMLALGFYPSEISKVSEAQRAKYKLSTKITERRGKLARDAARAILEGDTTDALEAVRTFNSKMPVFAIGGGDIRRAVRQIILGDMGIQGRRDKLISMQYGVPSY